LPPRWRPDPERLEGFLEALPRDQRFTCYLDNDERAYAPGNAQSLIENLHSLGADAASVHRRRSGKA